MRDLKSVYSKSLTAFGLDNEVLAYSASKTNTYFINTHLLLILWAVWSEGYRHVMWVISVVSWAGCLYHHLLEHRKLTQTDHWPCQAEQVPSECWRWVMETRKGRQLSWWDLRQEADLKMLMTLGTRRWLTANPLSLDSFSLNIRQAAPSSSAKTKAERERKLSDMDLSPPHICAHMFIPK